MPQGEGDGLGDADDSDASGDEDVVDQDPVAHAEQPPKASKSSGFAVMFFPMDVQAEVGIPPSPPSYFCRGDDPYVAGHGASPASQ